MDINRKAAYNTLFEIEKNKAYSNIELNNQINSLKPDYPAFTREIVYGVLENKIYIDYILEKFIARGIKSVKIQDLILLRMGIYQIVFMSVPNYAAVNETVNMAKTISKGREKFINGVLRNYLRKIDEITLPDQETSLEEYLMVKYSYSKWIVKLWLSTYGREKTEKLLASGNKVPRMSLRVNLIKESKIELKKQLEEQGIIINESNISSRVLLAKGENILSLESYEKGLFSVQDEASCFATEILNPKEGEIVLDICAAPGGKTLAMAELMKNKGKVYAFDIYDHKLELLKKEAARLGLNNIEIAKNDGLVYNDKYKQFADKVLVDGPCSGLGVIRKKPEIKYKEIEDEGNDLAEKQLQILKNSAEYVKVGGTLLYSTCTININENERVVNNFLKENTSFEKTFERQLMPDTDKTDGFYICKLERKH